MAVYADLLYVWGEKVKSKSMSLGHWA